METLAFSQQVISQKFFTHYRRLLWNDVKVQRDFLIEVSKTLNIMKPEDWYSVKLSTLEEHGGHFLANVYNKDMYAVFKSTFPGSQIL